MTVQLTKDQLAELQSYLAQYGLKVSRSRKPRETEAQRKARFADWGWKGVPCDQVKGITSYHRLGTGIFWAPAWKTGMGAHDLIAHYAPTVEGWLKRTTPPWPLLTYQATK